ncbi:sialate O-acetylesterase [Ferruginibacter albus]|uniref:sialate O-acetylesterase n=1 Tax=Ferruginibacter albus TaxID=2875540 RepID=UPI001CC4B749|nr:sialate O-acetylesterase [Ferruginibacter albus]UAY51141.1 sialate O-acetylesterase [Ferruginibacter albus]
MQVFKTKALLILLLFVFLFSACRKKKRSDRTKFFPEAELKPTIIPKKENLWVFIMAGQSNMAGRGFVEPQDTLPDNRIFTINKNGDLIIAKEPLHFYEPSQTGLDCGLSFGKELKKHISDSISILLIPTAVGRSSITQWINDSTFRNVTLLSNFKQKVKIAQNYGLIKGILWDQGETDAESLSDIDLYKDRLKTLFIKFRNEIGNNSTPVLIGQLGSFSTNITNYQKLNEQIDKYVSSDSNASIITTKDLIDRGDKIHFNSSSQRILGQRFADKFMDKYIGR